MNIMNKKIFANRALLPDGWANNILIEIDNSGIISKIIENFDRDEKGFDLDEDIIIPAMNNLHSHGFQRAMAGLTEGQSSDGNDSFWTWRNLMYKFLDVLTPEEIYVITLFSQMEMLEAGYTSVGEFHYIHNQIGGEKYDNITELSERVLEASKDSGIGICLLPVLYERGGCDGRKLSGGQLRFHNSFDTFTDLIGKIKKMVSSNELFSSGVAAHSLRAVSKEDLNKISEINDGPIHIHVAEQVQEVEEVEKFYGKRPVEWLIENFDINERWCFIHCTQMTKSETLNLANSGAVAGLCPVTEANLGDGIFNGLEYFQNKGMFGLGTDSNINISLVEEIKTFEYSQRLINKKRAVISNKNKSSGRIIFDHSLSGGSRALQTNSGKIENGLCADLLSFKVDNMELDGLDGDKILDYFIFASKGNLINRVWKNGKCLVRGGKHIHSEMINSKYQKTIKKLKNLL